MAKTIRNLRTEQVEINLGNHPPQNCTLEKWAWMKEHPRENPFVNAACWKLMLDEAERQLRKLVEKGYDK